jgi:DNA-binding PadR family transcriptional regulator
VNRNPPSYRNLWALTVLCLLRERPMHPYEMQRLIRQRKNDNFLDLKRGSLYHAIERLLQADLIAVVATTREGRRPERTTYRLTEAGEREVLAWLRELLANPARDSTQFFAGLSFLGQLTPEDALEQLEVRAGLLEGEIACLDAALRTLVPRIGRLFLLEVEYTRSMRQAELTWVRSVADDLRAGRLTWDWETLRKLAQGCVPPGDATGAGEGGGTADE